MLNESRRSTLRKLYPDQNNATLGDLLFDADMKKAESWNSHVADLKRQRQAIQDQLDGMDITSEPLILEPLRRAADAALAAHLAASAELEAARIECESKGTPLRNQIDALTRQAVAPEFPKAELWKTPDEPQIDAREAALAARTPARIGGGWVDGKQIDPGMPSSFN
jgi:hypothetical protein